jgi:exosome complex component RRP40
VKVGAGEVELSCVNPATGKAEGLGPLAGGCVFDVSLGLVRRLMMTRPGEMGGVVVLEELGGALEREGKGGFEVAMGRNGRVWVYGQDGDVKTTVTVGRCLRETDEMGLDVKGQRRLADRLVKAI